MNRFFVTIATAGAVAVALCAVPAVAAQCRGNVVAPHLVAMGTHATPTTGNGTVRVQVQINPNGSHRVTRVISSTNHGDDQAAREVAQSSTYRPATCSGSPVVWFYDPLFHFSGSTVSQAGGGGVGGGSSVGHVEALIRSGQYDAAKSAAQSELAAHPNDKDLLQLLGVADYYAHDYAGAADAFSRAGQVSRLYATVAAQAYADAAVHMATQDPSRALGFAQKAYQIDHSTNSRFALGVAQLGAKQYADAITTLQTVHATVFGDPHADTQTRYGVDRYLLEAYADTGDLTAAQPVADEMHRLEPSNTSPQQEIAALYITQGNAAMTAKNYDQAIALYDKAAAAGTPQVADIAYDRAANALANETHPDAARIKGYADKALAIDANDPIANFFEGFALAEQYSTSHNTTTKQQAISYLTKADALAKAAGNQSLAQNVERLLSQLNAAPAGMP
ncbi:MAG TPA: hypothetical protein VMV82_06685 [Candidatus Dormibacteraeota bacterium]|nr:hypothetical protein [Candidatus Dormibacteraeota bacterium]